MDIKIVWTEDIAGGPKTSALVLIKDIKRWEKATTN